MSVATPGEMRQRGHCRVGHVHEGGRVAEQVRDLTAEVTDVVEDVAARDAGVDARRLALEVEVIHLRRRVSMRRRCRCHRRDREERGHRDEDRSCCDASHVELAHVNSQPSGFSRVMFGPKCFATTAIWAFCASRHNGRTDRLKARGGYRGARRGCSSMAEPQPSKLVMPVRSRSPALHLPNPLSDPPRPDRGHARRSMLRRSVRAQFPGFDTM